MGKRIDPTLPEEEKARIRKERRKANGKRYYEANKQKVHAYHKQYVERHKEEVAEYQKRYHKENHDRLLESKRLSSLKYDRLHNRRNKRVAEEQDEQRTEDSSASQ